MQRSIRSGRASHLRMWSPFALLGALALLAQVIVGSATTAQARSNDDRKVVGYFTNWGIYTHNMPTSSKISSPAGRQAG